MLCAACLIAALGQTAYADEKSGWGISVGFGPTVIRDEDGSETFRGSSFGFIFGGEYRFSKNFALGLNLFSLGSGEDTIASVDTTIDVRGIDLAGRIILPVSPTIDIYGLIGTASYYADVEPGLSSSPFGSDAWEFGIGLDVSTSEKFAFRIEGRYFDGRRDETGGMITAGIAWHF
jgi:Outer membrane protein beta-barrel domain